MAIKPVLRWVAAAALTTGLACSCTGGHPSGTRWQAVDTAGFEVLTPVEWQDATPAAIDPTVRLLLVGPRVGHAPPSHFVLRIGQTPTAGTPSAAVRAYEQIGTLRNPTTTWEPPRSITVRGCRQAIELRGAYHAGDTTTGPLVHTLDVFTLRNDGVPEHLFVSAGGATLDARLTSRLLTSLSVSS